jgi:hypothetical protein
MHLLGWLKSIWWGQALCLDDDSARRTEFSANVDGIRQLKKLPIFKFGG